MTHSKPSPASSSPALSVVIPTYGRPETLGDTVTSVAAAQARAAIEVIVVDDGSPVPVTLPASPGVRTVRQPNGGLNVARNRGIAEAQATVIAFLDDDVLVTEGWADAMLACFEDPAVGAVGGRITLALAADPPGWLDLDTFGAFLSRYELGERRRRLTDADPLPFGANCAVRKPVADDLRGFAPGLDRHGGSLISGGDIEFFARVRRAGHAVVYDPAASVRHRIASDRLTRSYLQGRSYGQGQTDVILERLVYGNQTIGDASTGAVIRAMSKRLLPGSQRRRARRRLWLHYVRGRRDGLVLSEQNGLGVGKQ